MKHPPPADPSDAEFCSTREAADLLGVSIKTAQSWVESGVLHAWKTPGGHRRIQRASVTALLDQRHNVPRSASAPAVDRKIVLTVDDDARMHELYAVLIETWHLPVRHVRATSGFEGLLLIGELAPAIVISDLNMPGMDGFRMIQSLRKTRTHEDLKIIIVSGLSAAEIRDRGGIPDGIELFSKPVASDRLERHVRSLLGSA